MSESTGFVLPTKVYDFLKFLAMVLLPAVGAAYFSLAGIWGLPNADQVVGTITVIDTLLGVLLRISTNAYDKLPEAYDGHIAILVDEVADKKTFSLELDDDPQTLIGRDKVTFRVGTETIAR